MREPLFRETEIRPPPSSVTAGRGGSVSRRSHSSPLHRDFAEANSPPRRALAPLPGRSGATAPLVKSPFIKTSAVCSEREKSSTTEGGVGGCGVVGGLSARQVAGDLALILSEMNNRFC